jgi:phosphate acetyltransferase
MVSASNARPDAQMGHSDQKFAENVTFDEIRLGQTASLQRTLAASDVDMFAAMSGDINPTHFGDGLLGDGLLGRDADGGAVGHSLWAACLISALLGNELPGLGTRYAAKSLRFGHPVRVGDTVTTFVTVVAKNEDTRGVTVRCEASNQRGDLVLSGHAEVIAPAAKARCPVVELPELRFLRHDAQQSLIGRCRGLEPLDTAVIHPCDADSLRGAMEAASAGLIRPVLVGPEARIRLIAEASSIDLAGASVIDVAHSHEAASRGVAMVLAGEVHTMMKGSLHSDELLSAVTRKDGGLRTSRRISHAFVMHVPTYHKPLIVTDAAINIAPDLDAKADIAQNAIDLARVLGIEIPKVAILSAVETVTSKIPSTLEAASLCKMADRGQIRGGLLDGPLAFDNAISREAARTKGIRSEVAGDPDILLAPNLEAGNMVAKQLSFLANADAAGIVLGARVPVILTSRADSVRTRLASCAVAVLLADAQRRGRVQGEI